MVPEPPAGDTTSPATGSIVRPAARPSDPPDTSPTPRALPPGVVRAPPAPRRSSGTGGGWTPIGIVKPVDHPAYRLTISLRKRCHTWKAFAKFGEFEPMPGQLLRQTIGSPVGRLRSPRREVNEHIRTTLKLCALVGDLLAGALDCRARTSRAAARGGANRPTVEIVVRAAPLRDQSAGCRPAKRFPRCKIGSTVSRPQMRGLGSVR